MTHDVTEINSPDSEESIDDEAEWEDDEWVDDEEPELAEFLEKHLATIPNLEQYENCVFEGPGMYFTVSYGSVSAMPADPGCYARGGYRYKFFSGPTAEEKRFIKKMMDELGFDGGFFDVFVEYYSCEANDAEAIAFFKDSADKDEQAIFNEILSRVNTKKTPFDSITHFISAVTRYDLDENDSYYVWEGSLVYLPDNVCDASESLEDFGLSKEEWVDMLDCLDAYKITTDNCYWLPRSVR